MNYIGAGTIEFIADASDGLRADRIWFMEMNTRLQVEHPVTEAITGVDLVEWQFRAAAGEPVPLKQADIPMNGWAMEARLYAEDPANGFLPSIGKLEHFVLPDDIRVDTGVFEGGEVSQFYDPMIAKLIVHETSRKAAAEALADACAGVEVWPVKTNAGFLTRLLRHPRFVAADVDTGLIAAEADSLVAPHDPEIEAAAIALTAEDEWHARTYHKGADRASPFEGLPGATFGFRLNGPSSASYAARVRGKPVVRSVQTDTADGFKWLIGPDRIPAEVLNQQVLVGDRVFNWAYGDDDTDILFADGEAITVAWRGGVAERVAGGAASDGSLRAPMPGKIVATPAKAGDTVTKGQPVIVLEAMKMEHALTAPFDGVVGEIGFAVGDQVTADAVLAKVEAST